jgi:DNA segregation ATPase FtsK/SpoIIIE-like protein
MTLVTNDRAEDDAVSPEFYEEAVALSFRLPFISCSILQRTFRLSFSAARRLIEKLKSEGYSVLDEKDLVANPKIKIVFVNNAGTASIRDIIKKAHPNIEVIQWDA